MACMRVLFGNLLTLSRWASTKSARLSALSPASAAVKSWMYCGQSGFPRVKVVDDAIFVRDGNFWTSAGVTTSIDLALAFVEQDLQGTNPDGQQSDANVVQLDPSSFEPLEVRRILDEAAH